MEIEPTIFCIPQRDTTNDQRFHENILREN